MKEQYTLKNENGSVLVVALIMLVLLTLIGMSASTTSEIEMMIAGNERIYKENFYGAEGAAMEAVQVLENTDLENPAIPIDWLMDIDNKNQYGTLPAATHSPDPLEDHITEDANWNDSYSKKSTRITTVPEPRYLSTYQGVVKGGSLDMTKSKIYEYEIYGRSNRRNGRCVVSVGYRKAY